MAESNQSANVLYRKLFARNNTHPHSWNLQEKPTGKKLNNQSKKRENKQT